MSSSSEELVEVVLEDFWKEHDVSFDYTDTHLIPPQHKAVIDNDIESLKKLIKSGKSPNAIDNYRNTPLHLSILNDRKDIFDYLLSVQDISLDVANSRQMTPLMEAVTDNHILDIPTMDIINSEYYAIKLIKCGCDLDYQPNDKSGNTALHYTVIGDSTKVSMIKVVVELLEHGADVNCQNFSGETPLHIAVGESNNDLVHILLYYGAIATIHDDNGFLPFNHIQHCPDYLEDILFDMTFDKYKIKLKLCIFWPLMRKSSDMFYKILEKTSELIYDEYNLEYLPPFLFEMKANMVKMLFLKFPQLLEDLSNPLCNCVHYLNSDVGNTIELIYFFYENLNERSVDLSCEGLIFKLIRCKLPESTLSELVCTFLSYGFDLTTQDLEMVYVTYGYGELFKILLHMPIEKYNMRRTNFMPMIIYDVELISSFSGIPKVMDDDDRRRTSKFFTIHSGVVPSLLQLSRDVARKHLINSYKIRDNVQFFTLLRRLPISKVYKAILGFEQEICLNL